MNFARDFFVRPGFTQHRLGGAGYTLVETIIVIAVTAIIGLVAFFGINASREAEKLANAQKELIADLRSLQNKALAGADGGTAVYVADPSRYYSQDTYQGIDISPDDFYLCFYNPNRTDTPCTNNSVVITLSKNGQTKLVEVQVSDNRITVIKPL
jgi:type II secretory pathway pseudopilin PulG